MVAFLLRIWSFVKPYRVRLVLGLVCGVLYGLTNGLLVGVSNLVVNLIFTGSQKVSFESALGKTPALRDMAAQLAAWMPELKSPSSRLGITLLILAIPGVMMLRGLLGYLNIYFMNWTAFRAIADIRTRLFSHLQNLSSAFFSQSSTGDLIARITNDTQVLQGTISGSISTMISDPVSVLVLVSYLLLRQPKLTLVSVVVLPICLAPMIIYGRKVRKSARAMQTHVADLATLMHESFTGNRIIKAYNLEDMVLSRFKETTGKYIGQVMRVMRANEIPGQLMEFVGSLGVALVLLYVVFSADKAGTPPLPGDVLAFITAIFLMYQPLKNLTRLHNQLQQARAASSRVFELLDTPSTVVDPPAPVALNAEGQDIHFENVDFDYGEKPILRGINLTVKAGQMVALVGSSGSGKTTLTNLLLRFYDPQRGTVRVGKTDIRQVAVKDLRRQIALVAQDTILFNDTIRRNIGLGAQGANDAQIEAAARAAHAHEFILEKESGYDSIAGEKGITLSGGQRQRIAIARAILKDSPILVLDEATNSLDAESERAVQEDLEKLMEGRTTICIAHRLATTLNADRIVVFEDGRIVESGTHKELMKARGAYFRLFSLQFDTGSGSGADGHEAGPATPNGPVA
jgi:subfamily B ATP-binding cassette protein MsbA